MERCVGMRELDCSRRVRHKNNTRSCRFEWICFDPSRRTRRRRSSSRSRALSVCPPESLRCLSGIRAPRTFELESYLDLESRFNFWIKIFKFTYFRFVQWSWHIWQTTCRIVSNDWESSRLRARIRVDCCDTRSTRDENHGRRNRMVAEFRHWLLWKNKIN